MSDVRRGRLLDASAAPTTGERTDRVVSMGTVVVDQILSGSVEPVDYDQDHDEFALVLAGAAVLDVDGEPVELAAGDWVLLPARTPHRLVHTEPETSWLTIKVSRQ